MSIICPRSPNLPHLYTGNLRGFHAGLFRRDSPPGRPVTIDSGPRQGPTLGVSQSSAIQAPGPLVKNNCCQSAVH